MVGTVHLSAGFSTRMLTLSCADREFRCGFLFDFERLVELDALTGRLVRMVRSVGSQPSPVAFPALLADDLHGVLSGPLPDPGDAVCGWLMWSDADLVMAFTGGLADDVLVASPDGAVTVSVTGVRVTGTGRAAGSWPVPGWTADPGGVTVPEVPPVPALGLLRRLVDGTTVTVRAAAPEVVWRWQLSHLLHACTRAVTTGAPLTARVVPLLSAS